MRAFSHCWQIDFTKYLKSIGSQATPHSQCRQTDVSTTTIRFLLNLPPENDALRLPTHNIWVLIADQVIKIAQYLTSHLSKDAALTTSTIRKRSYTADLKEDGQYQVLTLCNYLPKLLGKESYSSILGETSMAGKVHSDAKLVGCNTARWLFIVIAYLIQTSVYLVLRILLNVVNGVKREGQIDPVSRYMAQ